MCPIPALTFFRQVAFCMAVGEPATVILFAGGLMLQGLLFPICQVRVVRFYVSCPASFSFSSAGPQLQALDRSVPRRTRTASSGSE